MKLKTVLKLIVVVAVLECLVHITFDAWDAECIERGRQAQSAMVMYTGVAQ